MTYLKFTGLLMAFLFLSPLSNAQFADLNQLTDAKQSALDFWRCLNEVGVDLNGQLYTRAKNNYRIKKIYNDTAVNGLYLFSPEGEKIKYKRAPGRERYRDYREITFSYNQQNQIIEKIIVNTRFLLNEEYPGKVYMASKYVYEYNDQGQIRKVSMFVKERYVHHSKITEQPKKYKNKEEWMNAEWEKEPRNIWEYQYGTSGKISTEKQYAAYKKGEINLIHTTQYTYNLEGFLIKTETSDHYYSKDQISELNNYEYNSRHQLTKINSMAQIEGKLTPYGSYSFQYDDTGILNKITSEEEGETYHNLISYEDNSILINFDGYQKRAMQLNDNGLIVNHKLTQMALEGAFKGYSRPLDNYYYEYEKID